MGRPLQIQLKPPSTPGGAGGDSPDVDGLARLHIPSTPGGAGGDRAPPLPVYRGVQRRAAVPRAWPPPTKFRSEIWGVGHRHRPLRDEREAPSTALASGAGRSVCASGRKGWVGHAAESIPEVSSNLGQSLSRPPGDSSLCTREPLACGGRESGRTHRSAPTRSSECPATPGGAGQSPPPTERRGIRRGLGR